MDMMEDAVSVAVWLQINSADELRFIGIFIDSTVKHGMDYQIWPPNEPVDCFWFQKPWCLYLVSLCLLIMNGWRLNGLAPVLIARRREGAEQIWTIEIKILPQIRRISQLSTPFLASDLQG